MVDILCVHHEINHSKIRCRLSLPHIPFHTIGRVEQLELLSPCQRLKKDANTKFVTPPQRPQPETCSKPLKVSRSLNVSSAIKSRGHHSQSSVCRDIKTGRY